MTPPANGTVQGLIITPDFVGDQPTTQFSCQAVMGREKLLVTWTVVIYKGRHHITELQMQITEDSQPWSVTQDFLRKLTLTELYERGFAALAAGNGHGHDHRRRPYQRITDDDLADVAAVFTAAVNQGRSGTAAVAYDFGTSEKTTERLIRRARARFPERMPTPRRGPRRNGGGPQTPDLGTGEGEPSDGR